jgi:hypothetical protein
MAARGSRVKLRQGMSNRLPISLVRPFTAFATGVLAFIALCACAVRPTALPQGDRDRLAHTAAADDRLVYDGVVFEQNAPTGASPVFRYERRVREEGSQRVSTHLTFAPTESAGAPTESAGAPMISLAATHTLGFDFVSLEAIDAQRGFVAGARMLDAHRVAFESTRGGRTRRRVERVDAPVVVGPTLFGWALAHWDALLRGEAQTLRFAAIDVGRTYGFRLALVERDASTTVLSFTATSAIVRAAVPPMRLVFDTTTRKILRYEGRVPPMLADGRGLSPLDARVEYTFAAPTYE